MNALRRFWRRTRSPSPLPCRDLVECITDYLEGTLPAEERARVDQHLAGCDGCTTYLEQMRETIALTGRLGAEQIPAELRQELLAAFQGWKQA